MIQEFLYSNCVATDQFALIKKFNVEIATISKYYNVHIIIYSITILYF